MTLHTLCMAYQEPFTSDSPKISREHAQQLMARISEQPLISCMTRGTETVWLVEDPGLTVQSQHQQTLIGIDFEADGELLPFRYEIFQAAVSRAVAL